MITGLHTMFFTSEPEALREFLKDKLGFKGTDVGGGWQIFKMPETEMGCHPDDPANNQPSGLPYISFICDNLSSTVELLKERGVEFVNEKTEDKGYGLAVNFKMPGNIVVELYQPKYKL